MVRLLFGLPILLLSLYIMKSEFPHQSLELIIFHCVCTIGKPNSLDLLPGLQTGLETVPRVFASCLTLGKFPHVQSRKGINNFLKGHCDAHSEILHKYFN